MALADSRVRLQEVSLGYLSVNKTRVKLVEQTANRDWRLRVGDCDGETVGETVGLLLGTSLGIVDGVVEGEGVGESLGDAEGLWVGASLGEAVGEALGDALGTIESVGASLPNTVGLVLIDGD